MERKIIFTSIDDLRLNSKKYIACSYKNLKDEFAEWIEECTIKNLLSRPKAELKAAEQLKSLPIEVYEQPFFHINGRSYFLDFFLPKYNLAIEIDGGYHKARKDLDSLRNSDLSCIGIRTIRIKNEVVFEGRFFQVLKDKLTTKKHKSHHKKHKSKTPKWIRY